jgi:SsrA-binding protein
MAAEGIKIAAQNKKARHDFFIDETLEAGIALTGTEVKSIRLGKLNLKDSYILIRNGEAYLQGVHISPYDKGSYNNVDPMRTRKLLLHKREILRLSQLVQQKGLALVPLSVYFKSGRAKVSVGVARGKKLYDKRADMAEKAAKRDVERAFREHQK